MSSRTSASSATAARSRTSSTRRSARASSPATRAGAPGQLDAELEREDWFVAPAGVDDIFNPDADELWARVLARKGAHFALVARMPIDPSVN